MENTFHVRNWRPNRIVFKYAGFKYILERRGDRQDTVALPIDAKSDPVVARWLKTNILEEIDRDDFVELATRATDGPFHSIRSAIKETDIPIENRNSSTPTTIPNELVDNMDWRRKHLSPNLEYVTNPPSTSEEVAEWKAKREKEIIEAEKEKSSKKKAKSE